MTRKQLVVPVSDELEKEVRIAAAVRGKSKAALIRDLLKQFLERESNIRTQGDEDGSN